MTWLIAGVVLWIAAHLFKRLLPAQRAALGNSGRGVVAVLIIIALIMIVTGYLSTEYVHLYALPDWVIYVNNLLMLPAIFLMDAGRVKGVVAARIRHPMLTGVAVWAIAHLLVNGDAASVVLFGGLGLWSVIQMLMINHAEGPWERPEPGPVSKDVRLGIIALFLYAGIVAIHYLFGYPVFAILE